MTGVAAQVEVAQIQTGGFRDSDLATVLAGTNDIIELYQRYPDESEATLTALGAGACRARGARPSTGSSNWGAKVVVSDVPNVGLTPYATEGEGRCTPTPTARRC